MTVEEYSHFLMMLTTYRLGNGLYTMYVRRKQGGLVVDCQLHIERSWFQTPLVPGCVLGQDTLTLYYIKYGLIPREQWLHLNMTEKSLSELLSRETSILLTCFFKNTFHKKNKQ